MEGNGIYFFHTANKIFVNKVTVMYILFHCIIELFIEIFIQPKFPTSIDLVEMKIHHFISKISKERGAFVVLFIN